MRRWIVVFTASLALSAYLAISGCASKPQPKAPEEPLWPTLPLQKVPNFMKGTLFERVRFTDLDVMPVYGYGLVVNLHNTGDSRAPTNVRDYIVKQMYLRGFGSYVSEMTHQNATPQGTYANVSPDEMLHDKRVAIVIVQGGIPVGARQGQSFDLTVRTLEHNNTTSLAHGELYETDLSDLGLIEPQSIGARQQAYTAGGPIFVNPAYELAEGSTATTRPGSASSLRVGTVLNGGVSRFDRPISLQLRVPQASTARRIEQLIAQRWDAPLQVGLVQGDTRDVVAKAENEGLVLIYVPEEYRGNWKHFLGVVSHLYLNQSPAFLARKMRELTQLAVVPGAPLADISLCWEAMGEPALSSFEPLISDPDPDVAFAAARAAAFLGDGAAREALVQMALNVHQHNQLEAVQVLSELPDSPEVDHMIAELLDSDRADVRIEAYRMLVQSKPMLGDSDSDSQPPTDGTSHYGIVTHDINHKFVLDVVPSKGPPLIYATSTGVPRIAIFGREVALRAPLTFTAMDMRLSITSSDDTSDLTIFYRDPLAKDPEHTLTQNDFPMILARLGGVGPPDPEQNFDLSFADVVAVAEKLVTEHSVYGASFDGPPLECAFELEHPRYQTDQWTSIPSENREGRPQGGSSVVSGVSVNN
jgi:hypothetical protein